MTAECDALMAGGEAVSEGREAHAGAGAEEGDSLGLGAHLWCGH